MTKEEILNLVDHTVLKQESTFLDVKEILDGAMAHHTASACISPCYVKRAKEYVGDRLKICTVIGFPNGTNSTAAKVFETKDAILNGANEIDMVINIGMLKAKEYNYILEEIKAIKEACGKLILKVIIETCLLTEEEKVKMCELVSLSGAEYIKTSTGFSKGGATIEDVRLMKKHISANVLVKAAGGIANMKDAEDFIEAGASRLGTSRLISKEEGNY